MPNLTSGKQVFKLILKLGISGFFLVWLSGRIDFPLVFSSMGEVNLYPYTVSTIITLISSIIVACKYHLLIKGTPINRSVLSLIKINLISRFYALFLPSAIGPEVIRWYRITKGQKGRILFTAITLFERLTFVFFLLIFCFVPLLFYSSNHGIAMMRARIFPVVLGSFVVVCLSLSYYLFPALFRSMINRFLSWRGNRLNINAYLDGFSLHRPGLSLYSTMFGLSLFFQLCFILRVFLLFKGVGVPLTLLDAAWMGSLVLLLQVLPISFAGIGVREGAYAYLFTLFGLPPEKGALIGVLFFSQMLILAGIGGIIEFLEK